MISISLNPLISPSTCVISGLSNNLTTCTIASTFLICDKNWLPNPSPELAPFTKPAISTNSIRVLIIFSVSIKLLIFSSLLSGTWTMPTLGSIVQNG